MDLLDRQGIPCTVASSADRVKVEANLRAVLGVPPERFAAVVTGEDVVAKAASRHLSRGGAAGAFQRSVLRCRGCDQWGSSREGRRNGCVAVSTSFSAGALAAAGADLVRPAIAEITLADLLV